MKDDDHGSTPEHTFQADFVMPINKTLTLDCGFKYIIRPCESNNYYFTGENENYVRDQETSLGFRHTDNISGAYSQLRINREKFSGRAGIRYEYSYQNVKYSFGNGMDFTNYYNNVVPSVLLSYKLSPKNNIGFSYNMRISRPNVDMLNPFVGEYFSKISYGNPNLKCEKYNDFQVFHSLNADNINLSTALLYKNTSQGIGQISFTENDKVYTTFVNDICNNEYGVNLYFSANIFDVVYYYANSRYVYKNLAYNALNLQSQHHQAAVYTSFEFYFTDALTLTIGWSGNTRSYGLQMESCSSSFGDFSLTYSLLDGRLDLAIKGITPFDDGKNKHSVNITQTSDYQDYVDFVYRCRALSFSLNWRFKGNAGVKKSQTSIKNNDMLNESISRK